MCNCINILFLIVSVGLLLHSQYSLVSEAVEYGGGQVGSCKHIGGGYTQHIPTQNILGPTGFDTDVVNI